MLVEPVEYPKCGVQARPAWGQGLRAGRVAVAAAVALRAKKTRRRRKGWEAAPAALAIVDCVRRASQARTVLVDQRPMLLQ
jgi:hypothetical protein